MVIKTYDAFTRLSTMEMARLINFIFEHFKVETISKESIRKSIQYSAKEIPGLGGYVFVIEKGREILGLVVVNKTGMGDYIPENFIVFFVVNKKHRDRNIEQKLMEYSLQFCKGNVSIHIRKNDPIKKLFEDYGFNEDYLEMRLKRK